VKQQGRQRRHDQHQRQRTESQHEARSGRGLGIGQRAAAQVAEDERCARLRGVLQCVGALVDQRQRRLQRGQVQEAERQCKGQRQAAAHGAPAHGAALLGQ